MSNSKELMSKIDANESNRQGSTDPKNMSSYSPLICRGECVENPMNVGQEDESYTKTKLGGGKTIINEAEQKVLGLWWNTETDSFLFDLSNLVENAKKCKPTKRNIVSMVSSIYDPIGFLSVTIQLKILLQELHERQFAWDEQLDKEWKQFIQNRVNEIRKLTPISSWKHCPGHISPADIPSRGMTPTDMVKCELWNHGPTMLHEKVEEEEQSPWDHRNS